MYEHQTYSAILTRMLAQVPDTEDKREGSIIHDALAPAAAELAQAYISLDEALRLGLGDTSSGEYLDRRGSEVGVERKQASKAQRKGLFWDAAGKAFDVPLGSRYSCDSLTFVVTSRISAGQFALECEAPGEGGNRALGKLLPISYVAGLARAELTDVLLAGEDREKDEQLRERILQKVRQPATSGNASHYIQWATSVTGVGAAKVTEQWNGPGTVKVSIVDTDREPASPALVEAAADYIETVRPVCVAVTVVSATGLSVNVAATIVLATGYTLQAVQDAFHTALADYLRGVAFAATYVSYAKIGTLLLGTDGVLDYTALSVNGGTANVVLADNQVPVAGSVELGV
ncbi:baseplate J/gp47 family protein [Paenibacillus sp. YN15]|uniref:baseplate J/gp47 family protein n=1 Tax=Paenibacillus sp. YN15 TaxID=1742774 RepID=UPI000DCB3F11|nr:baseplate J/gp47 family protein [Paenibacillus sp. YN15]RAU98119.1 baseplate J protein [Paenibacillus sp. YN15]